MQFIDRKNKTIQPYLAQTERLTMSDFEFLKFNQSIQLNDNQV